MKRPFFILVLFVASLAFAQDQNRPVRTPEEVAQKQTERLQRDLNLSQDQRDTIYRIHLKYAQLRKPNEEREIVAERIGRMITELNDMLTEEQRETFMIKIREYGPKRQSSPRMIASEAEVVAMPVAAQVDTITSGK